MDFLNNDWNLIFRLSNLVYEVQAVSVRQSSVQKNRVWSGLFQDLSSRLEGRHQGDGVSFGLQSLLEKLSQVYGVFDDE